MQPSPIPSAAKQPIATTPSSHIRTPSFQRPPLEPQPRRTQQLISPPLAPLSLPADIDPDTDREDAETPDPFLQDNPDPEPDPDPFSPRSSRVQYRGESIQMHMSRSHKKEKEPVLPGSESEDDDVQDSQLFPGSDLF